MPTLPRFHALVDSRLLQKLMGGLTDSQRQFVLYWVNNFLIRTLYHH